MARARSIGNYSCVSCLHRTFDHLLLSYCKLIHSLSEHSVHIYTVVEDLPSMNTTSRGQCGHTTKNNARGEDSPAFHNTPAKTILKIVQCCTAIVSLPQMLLDNLAIVPQYCTVTRHKKDSWRGSEHRIFSKTVFFFFQTISSLFMRAFSNSARTHRDEVWAESQSCRNSKLHHHHRTGLHRYFAALSDSACSF